MNRTVAIAIDGPAAAGKSTLARMLAGRLGFLYVDTGALYRAIGYFAHTRGADTANPDQVIPLLKEIEVRLEFAGGEQRVFLCGDDVSQEIRLPEMSMAASNVSAMPAVREFLLELQRGFARGHNVVMDGRDIGTVVLPGAQVKFFLTASPEIRARRRYDEFRAKGREVDYDALLWETLQRDYNDSHREIAPLRPAEDSIVVDSTELTLEQTAGRMLSLAKERLS